MMVKVNQGMLLSVHLGRKHDDGTLTAEQISFGKMENVRTGRDYGSHYIAEGGIYLDDRQDFARIFTASAGLRLQGQEHSGTRWIPRAGLRCRLSPETVLHGQVARGYRAPTVRDYFLFPPSTLGLKPEEDWNYELGVRQNIGSLLTVDLTGFYLDADNLIIYKWPEAINSGAVINRGLEMGVVFVPADWWESVLTYSYLDQNKRIPQAVRNLAEWVNRFHLGKITLQVSTSLVRGLRFSDREEDYCVTDLRLGWRPLEKVEFSLKASNIFDENYQATEGYPMPGRWLWSEAVLSF
jgi:iron complex outermembrane receptor protein